jgi:hypothetical protein
MFASPSTVLVRYSRTAFVITLSPSEPFGADARLPGGRFARYVSDPVSGIWRVIGNSPKELVCPFALQQVEIGRHGIAVVVRLPATGDTRAYEGDVDQVASNLHRAGRARGCRADRQGVFWALREFCAAVQRQAAARGVC